MKLIRKDNPWKTVATKEVYKNPWVRMREDDVICPDGSPGIYGVLEIGNSAGVVAVNQKDQVMLVGQWRYVHGKYSWEIPTGGEQRADEEPLEIAKRELREETGLVAEVWQSLGSIDNSNGVTNDVAHIFYATGIEQTKQQLENTEDITTKWVDFEEAFQMVMDGAITESSSVSAILKTAILRNQKAGRPD